jgi:hypothetical protein
MLLVWPINDLAYWDVLPTRLPALAMLPTMWPIDRRGGMEAIDPA